MESMAGFFGILIIIVIGGLLGKIGVFISLIFEKSIRMLKIIVINKFKH
ncbi:hypothetical protein [Clostridium sp. ZBS15]|nr:hypothetical protein [Clostridium sp. ZBS15]